jgi:uncharacterized lipoprotein YmbA
MMTISTTQDTHLDGGAGWRSLLRAGAVACLLAGLTACGSTAPSRFYVLTSTAQAPAVVVPLGVPVRINDVVLPPSVDRAQIVTMLSANEVQLSEFHRWSEPLSDNVTRVLVADLRALLGSDVTQLPGLGGGVWTVAVVVHEIQATLGEGCRLSASWTLTGGPSGTGRLQGAGEFEGTGSAEGYVGLAQATSTALGKLSLGVANSLRAAPAVTAESDD